MRKLINKQQIFENWAPVIEQSTSLSSNTDKERMTWMAEYCHYHSMNEAASATVTNVPGMGAIQFPGDPGAQQDFVGQAAGSGDNPASLLPLAMQVAAQTVGLDLVPVVPMDRPMTVLTYVDTVYADGKLNGALADAPSMVKLPVTSDVEALLSDAALGDVVSIGGDGATNTTAGSRIGTFLGRSRVDGYPIIKLDQNLATSPSGLIAVAGSPTTFNITIGTAVTQVEGDAGVSGKAELVKALEDHITGFSGKYFQTGDAADLNMPYQREEGEDANTRSLGFKFFNKSVEAQTFQADVAVTREQLQDSKQFGIDLMSMANSILANETTQGINKNVLERAFALGATNHKQIFATENIHFNVNFDDATAGPYLFELGLGRDGAPVSITAPAPVAKSTSGGETLLTAQRKVLDQILAAGNIISQRGRRGPANVGVTNTHVATLLQTISGFQAAPMANTFNQNNGALMPLGSIAGVSFYVDPNMIWADTRMCVWRKGDGQSPGLVMMPYMMAESVETIAENTMAPKIQVKSRYALAEAGHHPQVSFVTLKINTTGGLLR